ncbi:MAG TPA: glycogen-binding domain-containing protein [Longimicrobiales bacterium]|nr:glycogen-binding domain-containing protein [Longimicrobiales bacterium]
MNDRVQLALDGDEAALRALTSDERSDLREAEAAISRVLRQLPTRPLPDLSRPVMARIDQSERALSTGKGEAAGWRAALSWFVAPRRLSLQWRPAYVLAFAALAGIFAAVRGFAPVPVAPGPAQILVEFRLEAPDAHQVQLAGNFSDWKPVHTLTRGGAGTWTVVVPMTPGVHSYGFVVDGKRWVPDPMAPAVSDGFGGVNSQIAVLSPDQARSL